MNQILKKITCLLLLFYTYTVYPQEKIDYRVDVFGSASSGKYTPFWITSNTYGTVPLLSDNAYARCDVKWKHSFLNEIQIEAEADLVTAAKHSSSFWIQQLYAAIAYRNIYFYIGTKERYSSMLDKNLSMGDMTFSTNSRPIPEIYFAFPNFTNLPFTKDYIQFKSDFALGKSMENDYIIRTKIPDTYYNIDILYHHKSLSFKWEDPDNRFPFLGIIGLEHAAQWGGWTSSFGKQPVSLRDFIRIFLCESGDSGASTMDQINVLGNHLGTINTKIAYKGEKFHTALYKQHFYEDKSGLELANWRDGIWGGEITFSNQPFLQKIVLEYLQTTNQSGPLHFLYYDPKLYPDARGGGRDDYYNNEEYLTGWSYFGRGIGNALLTSPEYNDNHALGFKNNRVKAIHLGIEGKINSKFSYRTLFTGMQGWGTPSKPFIKRKDSFSSLIEWIYKSEKQKGWQITLQAAFDMGDLYSDNFGCSLKISKAGVTGK